MGLNAACSVLELGGDAICIDRMDKPLPDLGSMLCCSKMLIADTRQAKLQSFVTSTMESSGTTAAIFPTQKASHHYSNKLWQKHDIRYEALLLVQVSLMVAALSTSQWSDPSGFSTLTLPARLLACKLRSISCARSLISRRALCWLQACLVTSAIRWA